MKTEVVKGWFLHVCEDFGTSCTWAPSLQGVTNRADVWVEVTKAGDLQVEHDAYSEGNTTVYVPVEALKALLAAHEQWSFHQ